MRKKYSIIIIHWNTPELLEKQLVKLDEGVKNQIIVIDNNSNEKITFQNKFPNITFIENKINRGFAFACNQGALKALGEWLLFLNPDVETDNQQIQVLINWTEKNNLDASSPQPQSDNYKKPVPTVISLLKEFTPLGKMFEIPRSASLLTRDDGGDKTLTGGCLLIKTEIFKKLGGFDERFFLWFEDSDLTQRLIDNNYHYGFAPIQIKHTGGMSFKDNDKQYNHDIFFNSMYAYAKKYFSAVEISIIRIIEKKYSKRKLLPQINDGITITIPNINPDLLSKFLEINNKFFADTDEYNAVTSGIGQSEVWKWREKYPQVRFIPIAKNDGFAATVNIGFRVSTGKYIGTVNDDTVLNADWIKKSLDCAFIDPGSKYAYNPGSINPVIYKSDGSVESAGIYVLPKGKAIPKTKFVKEKNCFESDATNAAAVLYSREALNKTGLFDEKFGSYLEDIDLSLRLKRNGYANIVCTAASVIHTGQRTSQSLGAKKNWLDFKNWILVILKNWGTLEFVSNFPQIIIERLRNISGIIKTFGHPKVSF